MSSIFDELSPALRVLFDEYASDKTRVEIQLPDLTWRAIPLEWNISMVLADLLGCEVRIQDSRGLEFRRYPELQDHA